MSDNITSLNAERAHRQHDNNLITPVETLRDAMQEIESGERKADSVLVLTLDRGEGDEFNTGWYASRLKSSEMIAVMEAIKAQILQEMGVIR